MQFLFDYVADLFLMLIEKKVVAAEWYHFAFTVGEASPAAHIRPLHKWVLSAVKHGDITGKLYVTRSGSVALSHAYVSAEYAVEQLDKSMIGYWNG